MNDAKICGGNGGRTWGIVLDRLQIVALLLPLGQVNLLPDVFFLKLLTRVETSLRVNLPPLERGGTELVFELARGDFRRKAGEGPP